MQMHEHLDRRCGAAARANHAETEENIPLVSRSRRMRPRLKFQLGPAARTERLARTNV